MSRRLSSPNLLKRLNILRRPLSGPQSFSDKDWKDLKYLLESILSSSSHKLFFNVAEKLLLKLKGEETFDHEIIDTKLVEQALLDGKWLSVKEKKTNQSRIILPKKILFLEGILSLIAETKEDKILLSFPLNELKIIHLLSLDQNSTFQSSDVESFIRGVRELADSEERLILKITEPENLNLHPEFQFLAKPFIVANPMGVIIWAAYVEPGPQLFDWIISLGDKVEVLDPPSFKQNFEIYSREKFRKIA
jgi:hypothetical protein